MCLLPAIYYVWSVSSSGIPTLDEVCRAVEAGSEGDCDFNDAKIFHKRK